MGLQTRNYHVCGRTIEPFLLRISTLPGLEELEIRQGALIDGTTYFGNQVLEESAETNYLNYNCMIGTGGIGTGMFFLLEGDHTLGRNESRLGEWVPYKDYCKLHIISHYAAVLLGAKKSDFEVIAIGKVGDDEPGHRMIGEMKGVGMDVSHVDILSDASTLYSVCFQYPDSTGGNITTSNSASGKLTMETIIDAVKNIQPPEEAALFLAAPEVPVEARIALLKEGRKRKGLNVASFFFPLKQDNLNN